MTIHWKAVEQLSTLVVFVFNFTQFVSLESVKFGHGTVKSERVDAS